MTPVEIEMDMTFLCTICDLQLGVDYCKYIDTGTPHHCGKNMIEKLPNIRKYSQ